MNLSFEGRLNRQPYIVASIVINIISSVAAYFLSGSSSTIISIVSGIITLALCIFGLSLLVRRLHDLDKSGWFALIMLIPFIDILFWLYTLIAKGTDGPNRFGEDPLQAPQQTY